MRDIVSQEVVDGRFVTFRNCRAINLEDERSGKKNSKADLWQESYPVLILC